MSTTSTTSTAEAAAVTASQNTERDTVVVVTHSGVFHADDVMACTILKKALSDIYVQVVRSRNPAAIATADIAVDVGGEHDPARGRYDHHQAGGAGARPSGTPLASAGLVWRFFGREVVRNHLADEMAWLRDQPTSHALKLVDVAAVAKRVDERLIEPIDATDTGYNGPGPLAYTASHIISAINPVWFAGTLMDFDNQFLYASHIADVILTGAIREAVAECAAAVEVDSAVHRLSEDYPILVLERFVPWQDRVVTSPDSKHIMLVVFPGSDDDWMVQVVPEQLGHFGARMDLPSRWRGLRGAELDAVTEIGIEGAIFCHAAGFIAGHASKEGAIKMAEQAIRHADDVSHHRAVVSGEKLDVRHT